MADEPTLTPRKSRTASKAALALGAAGLFLYIVGVKRRHRLDAAAESPTEDKRDKR